MNKSQDRLRIEGWSECKLFEICDSIDYGYTASASNSAAGPRFLRITDIVRGAIDWESVPSCEINFTDAEKYRLRHGDIVVARTGATTGYSAFIDEPPDAVFASYLIRLRISLRVNARFVYYFLKSPLFWSYMHGVLGDKSAQPNASATTITKARIFLPSSIHEQRAIAEILAALDDKITLNRRMNQTLEAMARAIFRSWFVDFDPALKDHPLFPRTTQESALGRIPAGWEIGRLDDLIFLQRGYDLPTGDRRAGQYPVIAASGPNGYHDEFMARGPGVVTGRSGVLGNVFLILNDFWPLNTTLWVKEFRGSRPAHAYLLLSSMDFSSFNAGSAVPTLNRNHVHSLPVVLPPLSVIEEFETRVLPMFEMCQKNDQQSCTLASLRDTLLPKLLSGEIRVKQAEKMVGEAV